jgi:hypothetical protein
VIKNNQLLALSPWCVLRVNEATIVGYAPSWIHGSGLEVAKFLVVALEYPLFDYSHLGLQHQYLSGVILSM